MPPVKLGQGVVFRPGTAFDERWAPNQFLSGFVTSIFGDDASIVVFPDAYEPFYEMRVKRDDSLSQDRTWTPSVGEDQTMPEAPSDGQIYGRRNQSWTPVSGEDQGYIQSIVISDTAPLNGLVGMAWFDTTINNFYIFEQGKWVEPGHVNPTEELSVNIFAPVITGNVAVDSLLHCSTGEWTNSPISFGYQWMEDGVPIASASSNSWTVTGLNVGHDLTCVVTALNRIGYSQPATSNTMSVKEPGTTGAPVIGGVLSVGGLLACSTGTWSNYPVTYAYQWKTNLGPLVGQTNNSYTIVVGDLGKDISCEVVATNLIGSSLPATSNVIPLYVPVNTASPVASGVPYIGAVLSCTAGTWSGPSPTLAYQWMRSLAPISSQTNNTYTMTVADTDTNLTCEVRASNIFGTSLPAMSNIIFFAKTATLNGGATNVTLSNGNLRAVHTNASTDSGARSTSLKTTGKWYFETTVFSMTGLGTGFGLITEAGTFANMVAGTNCVKLLRSGTFISNNGPMGPALVLDPLNQGDVVQWAFDLTSNLFWARKAGGLWFNAGGSNPVTGANGLSCSTFDAVNLAPAACFGGTGTTTGEEVTFNFGATAFASSVPSGYNPGWIF